MMKALLLAATLFAVPAFAQTSPTPFKGADAVKIVLPDSGTVAAQRVAAVMTQKGYSIKSSDLQLGSITTNEKMLSANVRTAVYSQMKGHEVLLAGTVSVKLINVEGLPIVYRGNTSGTWGTAWLELEGIAKALGGIISYQKR